jgi:hypothetical protein
MQFDVSQKHVIAIVNSSVKLFWWLTNSNESLDSDISGEFENASSKLLILFLENIFYE